MEDASRNSFPIRGEYDELVNAVRTNEIERRSAETRAREREEEEDRNDGK